MICAAMIESNLLGRWLYMDFNIDLFSAIAKIKSDEKLPFIKYSPNIMELLLKQDLETFSDNDIQDAYKKMMKVIKF